MTADERYVINEIREVLKTCLEMGEASRASYFADKILNIIFPRRWRGSGGWRD